MLSSPRTIYNKKKVRMFKFIKLENKSFNPDDNQLLETINQLCRHAKENKLIESLYDKNDSSCAIYPKMLVYVGQCLLKLSLHMTESQRCDLLVHTIKEATVNKELEEKTERRADLRDIKVFTRLLTKLDDNIEWDAAVDEVLQEAKQNKTQKSIDYNLITALLEERQKLSKQKSASKPEPEPRTETESLDEKYCKDCTPDDKNRKPNNLKSIKLKLHGECFGLIVGCGEQFHDKDYDIHHHREAGFLTLDLREDAKPDFVGDITKPLPHGLVGKKFETIIFEHTTAWSMDSLQTVKNIRQLLLRDGCCIIYTAETYYKKFLNNVETSAPLYDLHGRNINIGNLCSIIFARERSQISDNMVQVIETLPKHANDILSYFLFQKAIMYISKYYSEINFFVEKDCFFLRMLGYPYDPIPSDAPKYKIPRWINLEILKRMACPSTENPCHSKSLLYLILYLLLENAFSEDCEYFEFVEGLSRFVFFDFQKKTPVITLINDTKNESEIIEETMQENNLTYKKGFFPTDEVIKKIVLGLFDKPYDRVVVNVVHPADTASSSRVAVGNSDQREKSQPHNVNSFFKKPDSWNFFSASIIWAFLNMITLCFVQALQNASAQSPSPNLANSTLAYSRRFGSM